jgi:hypothetical protein
MRRMLIVLILAMLVPAIAGADLTVKEKTTLRGFMGIWTSEGIETTYLKDGMYRNETAVERSGMVSPTPIEDPPPRITIVRPDKGVLWRVNLKDRTYQEVSLEDKEASAEAHAHFEITDIKVEPTGETKEIAGRECVGVNAKVALEVDKGDVVVGETADMVLWMTEQTEGLEGMRSFWDASLRLAQGKDQDIPIWDALASIREEMEELKGVVLGMEMLIKAELTEEERAELEEQVRQMLEAQAGEEGAEPGEEYEPGLRWTKEVIAVSDKKLDASLFEVPKDFRRAARIRIW